MHIVLLIMTGAVLLGGLHYWRSRPPKLPQLPGDWGAASSDDPRISAAAMMVAVATEDGPLTPDERTQILALLHSTMGLEDEVARTCLSGGENLAVRQRGDLNARLHQMRAPIARQCSEREKQDVIDMLYAVAGKTAERRIAVRDALGRIATSLMVT